MFAGISLDTVSEMTIDQVKLLCRYRHKHNLTETVNTINSIRIGMHADEKNYDKIIRRMEAEIKL